MRLIDGDALWDKFDKAMRTLVKSTGQENLTNEALSLLCGTKIISDAPTVDAAIVVPCETCLYWIPYNAEEGDCSGQCTNGNSICKGHTTDMNWFCADGERGA